VTNVNEPGQVPLNPVLMTAFLMMANVKRHLSASNRRQVPLSTEEFDSLKVVSTRPLRRTIPDKHRDHLIAAGYIREVVQCSDGISALAVTGRGLRRLSLGK
jgi:hypothetical protein